MNWLIKAVTQKSLSYLPNGEQINYFFQRQVTKGLPVGDEKFCAKVLSAIKHFNAFLNYCASFEYPHVTFYEFGAGWDLITPLTYYALGVEHQTLVDIRPNLRYELINDSLQKFSKHKSRLEHLTGKSLRTQCSSVIENRDELKDCFGITYLAPLDASDTRLPAESYDFISNTSTLEHISNQGIRQILIECRRLLKPTGVMSSIIDLQDHYSYSDRSISCYNFLQYSDALWNLIDSPLHFQNRLRSLDYSKLFEMSGMAIIAQEVNKPNSTELELLQTLKLAPRFQSGYSLEELGAKNLHLVARKGNSIL